jgi:hypothetical protein
VAAASADGVVSLFQPLTTDIFLNSAHFQFLISEFFDTIAFRAHFCKISDKNSGKNLALGSKKV